MKKAKSIAELRPDLAAQFDCVANYPLTPENVSVCSERKLHWVCEHGHTWINDPRHRSRAKHADCPICSGRIVTPYVNDLLTLCPHLESEWNYVMNGELDPRTLHQFSNRIVWWTCKEGHEWRAMIGNRTKAKNPTGCPYCKGCRTISGINDIASKRPDLAAQWDYEENFPLRPDTVALMSARKLGWVCINGHRWLSSPQSRAQSKHAECPFCNEQRVIPGQTDLFALYPHLEKQWNFERNADVDPHTLHRSSNKRVWWRCDEGHEWETAISHRTNRKNGTNCPFCTRQMVTPGVNDLASQRPDIAKDWDYQANAPLLPTHVMVGSSKKVYWQCKEGHQWKTSIAHRTADQMATRCPYCDNRRAIPGKTDLATLRPDLMTQWDWELNVNLDPTSLRPDSNKKAHWKCKKGHRWQATISSRNRKRLDETNSQGCPYCYGRYPISGETDLATRFPEIAAQWDPENNGQKEPSKICSGSNYKAAWICNLGHRWRATVGSRTCGGNNCPICSGRKPDVGRNDLQTVRPDLALDWDDEGNGGYQPQDFTYQSTYIAVWQCHVCGTKWSKTIAARVSGNKCPRCYRGRFKRVLE